jgi:hypothetical protein
MLLADVFEITRRAGHELIAYRPIATSAVVSEASPGVPDQSAVTCATSCFLLLSRSFPLSRQTGAKEIWGRDSKVLNGLSLRREGRRDDG